MARLTLCAAALPGVPAGAAGAQVTLSGQTGCQGGVPGTVRAHPAEVALAKGIASIRIQQGQTLAAAVQNLAEGKTDIASAPGQGRERAGNLRVLSTSSFGSFGLVARDTVGLKG